MMKLKLLLIPILILNLSIYTFSQDNSISPSSIITGLYLGETPPLRDLPTLTEEEKQQMVLRAEQKMLNPKIRIRSYPYAATALPKGPDPVWQRTMGGSRDTREPLINFAGQASPYYPPDANGTVGPNHYMQTINTVYTIYNKAGNLLAGPSALNTLFSGVPGSSCNNGDPIVLYDEQADRWLVAEFSLCEATDYMLIAVSTTNDPTGTWHKYSFDVDDMPDYEKFGIWQDGYYMGTNNSTGNDIYVFQRSQMLTGGTAQGVGFNNPWRPTTIDGFMCVPPIDNDGTFAPAGAPGMFITINDDAIGGGTDQLWLYELDVDWTTPANSTFTRIQQIDVAPFDSDFGDNWDNIKQPGTSKELDAIPQVIMNVPQYRNFGSYQTIVCCHTVDVDATDHSGIRWYELRKTGSTWSIRQQGTYAPDSESRWMGSIMLNNYNELGLAYSISSTSVYPGIRYTGQSASAYTAATGTLDATEEVIQNGISSQTAANRYGDYAALQVDPTDNETFWFTTEYIGAGGARNTKIASFQIGTVSLNANFAASNPNPIPNTVVNFTDLTTGGPVSWSWNFTPNNITYLNGTSQTSQNPQVSFNSTGFYTVSLTVSDGTSNDTETKTNFIHAYTPGLWSGATSTDWNTASNWDGSVLPTASINVTVPSSPVRWPSFTGSFTLGNQCNNLTLSTSSQMNIYGDLTINNGKVLNMMAGSLLNLTGNWTNNGTFTAGTGTVQFSGSAPITVASNVSTPDVTSYEISNFTKGMTPLTGATTGPSGDDNNSNVPIGFSFSYAGTTYTTAKISVNGWLSLNVSGGMGYDNAALFTNGTPNVTLTGWWDDLIDDGTSVISYKTEGTSPNRVFTAEWKQIPSFYSGASARISFQVKLFESTNVIEYHYGDVEEGTHNASEGASIGIEDAIGGAGHFKEATTGSTTTTITNLVSTSNWPTVNYRFTPETLKQTFNNIILLNTGSTLNFNVDTDVNGFFVSVPGSRFQVNSGKTLKLTGTSN